MTYRKHFADEEAAIAYDDEEYGSGSYGSLLWEIEAAQLDHLLADTPPSASYLDFACGTGRVLSHLSRRFDDATGIEISAAMAKRARDRVGAAHIMVKDITAPDCAIEGHYDVITAFRFVLNAEPKLRLAGLRALRIRLTDPDGVLLFNNHGNLVSHKLVMALPRTLRSHGSRRLEGNLLTSRSVRRLAHQAGLDVERVAGAGLLGGRVASRLPRGVVRKLECWFATSRLARFGSNQIYLARARIAA